MFMPIIIFTIIEAYLFIWVLVPYMRYDQFQFWDAAGHFFAAWFQKTHLFPFLSGWNPFFFCGYPQGTFYGPAFHYLVALLSFPLGITAAFKTVIVLGIAILPFSLYYLARKLEFDPNESSVITFLAMVPIAGLSLACGGTLFSQFIVGLCSNAAGLPLFLFYFGKLKEQISKLNNGEIERISPANFIVLTALASIIILTNFVVAFAAAIVAFVLIINSSGKKAYLFCVKHILLVFLLCSFFLLPLIFYSSSTENEGTILSMGFFLTVPLFLLILLGGAASAMDKDKRFDAVFFTLIAVFAVLVFMDFGQVRIPMHAYRFIPFFLILAMFLPVKLVFNKIDNKPVKCFAILAFIVLVAFQFSVMLFYNPRKEINYNTLFVYKDSPVNFRPEIDLGILEGRIMLLETPSPLAPHATEHFLAVKTGNYFLKGLFAESSGNAYPLALLRSKMFNVLSLGGEKNYRQKDLILIQDTKKLLDLFQINYLLSEFPIKNARLIKTVPIRSDKGVYYLYNIGNNRIAGPVPYKPYFTDKNWKAAVYSWVESPDPKILVQAGSIPSACASKNDLVEVVDCRPTMIKLKVTAKENIPILVKISYFPRWHAYSDGKPIKIYKAAPSLMLIYGKGEVVLEYKLTIVDKLGWFFTLLGIALLLLPLDKRCKKV